jgi:hypothetical protein
VEEALRRPKMAQRSEIAWRSKGARRRLSVAIDSRLRHNGQDS